jgi:hypothetical protein
MPVVMPGFTVTQMRRSPSARRALGARLPETRTLVREVNRSLEWNLAVSPGSWLRKTRAYPIVGTAFDYLVGAVWARRSLSTPSGPFRRAREATCDEFPETFCVLRHLERLLEGELADVREGRDRAETRDFFRGLALLAECDAVFRAGVEPPEWTLVQRTWTTASLRRTLRRRYPYGLVDELCRLYEVAADDLPKHGRRTYNPVFGVQLDRVTIDADGDLLLGDLLVDLKVSVEGRFRGFQVWQLLCYAALDSINGRNRVREVGLYNPRFRVLWRMPVEDVVARAGGGTFGAFAKWFEMEAPRLGRMVMREHP